MFHMTRNYVPVCREPCANTYECVWYGTFRLGTFTQMRCNANYRVSWCNYVATSLCNKLYAGGHVHYCCGSRDPSTVQLLIDTTTVLHEKISPSASLGTTT